MHAIHQVIIAKFNGGGGVVRERISLDRIGLLIKLYRIQFNLNKGILRVPLKIDT